MAPIERATEERNLRVLLIEDHAVFAGATAEFLRDRGLEVRIAGSGEEGLHAARVFRPHIALCDLHLPDMSGLDVARAFRASPDTKDLVFAMHTSMSDLEVQSFERSLDPAVVDLFLPKPITEERLEILLAGLTPKFGISTHRVGFPHTPKIA